MKMLRKCAALGLVMLLTLSMAGCGKKENGEGTVGAGSDETVSAGTGENDKKDSDATSDDGGFKYWSEVYDYPTESGEIHPYLMYDGKRIDAPFTPEEFFEGHSDIICGWYNKDWQKEIVDQVSDIGQFKDGELDWLVNAHGHDGDYLPVRTEDNRTEMRFYNLSDKDADPGRVYNAMAYSVSEKIWDIVDENDYEHDYSTQIDMSNQEDIEHVFFDTFGVPTSAYEDANHSYVFYWETNAYTVEAGAWELYLNINEDVQSYEWCGFDVTYYSANCPDEVVYDTINDDNRSYTELWNHGPVEVEWDENAGTGDAGSEGTETREIMKYQNPHALEELGLTGTLSVDRIDVSYDGTSCVVEPDFDVDQMLETFGEATDYDERHDTYKYGTSGNANLMHSCPLEISFHTLDDGSKALSSICVSFETAAPTSMMGVDAYSTPEDMAALFGTPSTIGTMYISSYSREQHIGWGDITIGGFDIDYIDAFYYNGVLTELEIVFE